jgi:hypothetical protein
LNKSIEEEERVNDNLTQQEDEYKPPTFENDDQNPITS